MPLAAATCCQLLALPQTRVVMRMTPSPGCAVAAASAAVAMTTTVRAQPALPVDGAVDGVDKLLAGAAWAGPVWVVMSSAAAARATAMRLPGDIRSLSRAGHAPR